MKSRSSKRQTVVINGVRYFADRPNDCKDCLFWKNTKQKCVLKEHNCYYLTAPMKEFSKCQDCPYAKGRACVSLTCYRELAEMARNEK